jgi:hypothetical protein
VLVRQSVLVCQGPRPGKHRQREDDIFRESCLNTFFIKKNIYKHNLEVAKQN